MRALRLGPNPQLTIRSGWSAISGVGIVIASALPADLDPTRSPGVDALEVVDHDRRSPRADDVTELLRPLELVTADVDRVAGGVVDPSDRDHMGGTVRADGRDPTQLPAAPQVLKLCVAEHARSH